MNVHVTSIAYSGSCGQIATLAALSVSAELYCLWCELKP
uniref:Uncharacterized protein n=1 Tax=Anguilla anguilla TaxID=7936 RepID=A0A0E9S6Y7_ANGAN